MFYKKGVLKNFAKFTGKHLCQSLFLNKVAGLVDFVKFLRTPFLQNTPGRLLSSWFIFVMLSLGRKIVKSTVRMLQSKYMVKIKAKSNSFLFFCLLQHVGTMLSHRHIFLLSLSLILGTICFARSVCEYMFEFNKKDIRFICWIYSEFWINKLEWRHLISFLSF